MGLLLKGTKAVPKKNYSKREDGGREEAITN